jgi:hypothetical protein
MTPNRKENGKGVGIEFEVNLLHDFSIFYILVIGFIRRLEPK